MRRGAAAAQLPCRRCAALPGLSRSAASCLSSCLNQSWGMHGWEHSLTCCLRATGATGAAPECGCRQESQLNILMQGFDVGLCFSQTNRIPCSFAGTGGAPASGVRLPPKEQAYVNVIQQANQAAAAGNMVGRARGRTAGCSDSKFGSSRGDSTQGYGYAAGESRVAERPSQKRLCQQRDHFSTRCVDSVTVARYCRE